MLVCDPSLPLASYSLMTGLSRAWGLTRGTRLVCGMDAHRVSTKRLLLLEKKIDVGMTIRTKATGQSISGCQNFEEKQG